MNTNLNYDIYYHNYDIVMDHYKNKSLGASQIKV